jgi:Protein of unknown function (DUF2510)
MAAPGWYPDPQIPNTLRWWDGSAWTSHTFPGMPTPSVRPHGEERPHGRPVVLAAHRIDNGLGHHPLYAMIGLTVVVVAVWFGLNIAVLSQPVVTDLLRAITGGVFVSSLLGLGNLVRVRSRRPGAAWQKWHWWQMRSPVVLAERPERFPLAWAVISGRPAPETRLARIAINYAHWALIWVWAVLIFTSLLGLPAFLGPVSHRMSRPAAYWGVEGVDLGIFVLYLMELLLIYRSIGRNRALLNPSGAPSSGPSPSSTPGSHATIGSHTEQGLGTRLLSEKTSRAHQCG